MFPVVGVARFLNLLLTYLASCSFARLGYSKQYEYFKGQQINRPVLTGRLIEIPSLSCGNSTAEKRVVIEMKTS
jgi:hypothetical protein